MQRDMSNLLYRRPELYEAVYGADKAGGKLAERLFRAHLGRPPVSLLDVGCGIGHDLEYLAQGTPDAVGVDYQESMITYARQQRPTIDFRLGDMRTLRLGRTFEAIMCFGWAIANVHSNDEVDLVMATLAAHSTTGTLLLLELIDPAKLDHLSRRYSIGVPGLRAEAVTEYALHPADQLLERRRTWATDDGQTIEDHVRLRLLYPKEVEHYLHDYGLDVVGTEELAPASMVVVAVAQETV